jgi:hypothetical protein
MAGIMAAMKSFDELGSMFSNNPALKAIQQAQQKKQAQQQAVSQVAGVAGVAGAAPAPAAPAAPMADTDGLEARIAALETAGSNTPSAPSSMAPQAVATGEAIFGTQEQRNSSINPFNSALI